MSGQSRAAKRREKKKNKGTLKEKSASANLDSEQPPSKRQLLDSESEGEQNELFTLKKRARVQTTRDQEPKIATVEELDDSQNEPKILKMRKLHLKDQTKLTKIEDLDSIFEDESLPGAERARKLLSWVIAPLSPEDFLSRHFESQPLLLQRHEVASDWYRELLSTKEIKETLKHQTLVQGVDLTFTQYDGSVRHNLHKEGEGVGVALLDSQMKQGSSLRLMCPQKCSDRVWALLSGLEEMFGMMVGSNAYLTPSSTQGFAPHYDDIEAFILQLEGKKRWRVYANDEEGPLPRFPSEDFPQDQLPPQLCDVVLEPGDLLYLPRGMIHQGETVGDVPSLHLTLSTGQNNTWADLLELMMPQAIGSAIQETVSLRQSLPASYLDYVGACHSDMADEEDDRRPAFRDRLRIHLTQIVEKAVDMMDAAADQMAKKYLSDRLPPVLTPTEEAHTAEGCPPNRRVGPLSKVKIIRKDIARLVLEDGVGVLYHSMENSRVHHGAPLRPLEFPLEDTLAIDTLLAAYPQAVTVKDLPHPPHEDLTTKVDIATTLFKEGILYLEDDDA